MPDATTHPAVAARPEAVALADLLALAKPGIVKMVVITTAVGFMLAALAGPAVPMGPLLVAAIACLVGAALSAAGANTINQAVEADRDARMRRTADRPIPAGRITPTRGLLFGVLLAFLGISMLAIINGAAPAVVSLVTVLTYLLCYTPLKPFTPLATVVGAVPGALPPLIGWTAAAGGSFTSLAPSAAGAWVGWGGWSLFLIMFIWQIPHFLAIAWKYRDDYAAGGYSVLPSRDPSGARTARSMLIWSAALVAAGATPFLWLDGIVGVPSLIVPTITGLAFLATVIRFAVRRRDTDARLVFVASIIYLPVTLIALVLDALARAIIIA